MCKLYVIRNSEAASKTTVQVEKCCCLLIMLANIAWSTRIVTSLLPKLDGWLASFMLGTNPHCGILWETLSSLISQTSTVGELEPVQQRIKRKRPYRRGCKKYALCWVTDNAIITSQWWKATETFPQVRLTSVFLKYLSISILWYFFNSNPIHPRHVTSLRKHKIVCISFFLFNISIHQHNVAAQNNNRSTDLFIKITPSVITNCA